MIWHFIGPAQLLVFDSWSEVTNDVWRGDYVETHFFPVCLKAADLVFSSVVCLGSFSRTSRHNARLFFARVGFGADFLGRHRRASVSVYRGSTPLSVILTSATQSAAYCHLNAASARLERSAVRRLVKRCVDIASPAHMPSTPFSRNVCVATAQQECWRVIYY